jgi:hypothetical protein
MPNTTVLPYVRGSVVNITAEGLKPLTQVYPFFDGQDVSAHCKNSTDSAYTAPALITDSKGYFSGQFRVPEGTFLTGTKIFTLTNDATGNTTTADCVAIATFSVNEARTFELNSILSTQVPNITTNRANTVQNPVTARQTFGISYKDPIAQTFFIQNNPQGAVLTKIDVYFKTRPTTNTPITLEIRETKDGFPTDNILPYSTVTLYPKDVNPSDDASAPTQFVFPSPVYVKNNTEYCFVLLPAGDNMNYEVWIGKIGATAIGSYNIIDSQPNVGRLVVANNSAQWTVYDDRDIKFTLYQAQFNNVTGTLELKNKKNDYITVPSSVTLYAGDLLVQSTGTGTVLYVNQSTNSAEVLNTSGYFVDGANTTSNGGTPFSITLLNGNITHSISPVLSYLNFSNTATSWQYKMYSSTGVVGSYMTMPQISSLTEGEKQVYSYSVENQGLSLSSTTGSLMVKGTLVSDKTNISPLVDIQKSHFIALENHVDIVNTVTAETVTVANNLTTVTGSSTTFLDPASSDYVVIGAVLRNLNGQVIGVVKSIDSNTALTLHAPYVGNSISNEQIYIDNPASSETTVRVGQYITKNVVLANDQDADDIIVYVNAAIPSGTDVLVYAKLLSSADSSGMNNRTWALLERQLASSALGIAKYQYVLKKNTIDEQTAVGGLSSSGVFSYTSLDGTSSYDTFKTFAIKIVMTTSNPAIVPSVFSMGVLAILA